MTFTWRVLSATLRSNIPKDMSGSFFVGDKGQIFYTLCDAIVDHPKSLTTALSLLMHLIARISLHLS